MEYKQGNASEFMVNKYGPPKRNIAGKLHKTERKVKPIRFGVRMIYRDDAGQEWVKINGEWWHFPKEIEY